MKWKTTYLLCCSHGLLVNEKKGAIEYDCDNVGPSKVVKEHLKRVKTTDPRDLKCNRPNVVGKDEDYCC